FVGSLVVSVIAGLLLLAVGMRLAWITGTQPHTEPDESRRRFILGAASAGIGAVAAGSTAGRVALRTSRTDPGPDLDHMARAVGSDAMLRIRRGFHPTRSGDLQLVLEPWNTSNYPNESLELAPRDPRSSHAMTWGYLDRVPITVYAPGIVSGNETRNDEVTLADLAPTTAAFLGMDFPTKDGNVLPGVTPAGIPPKVIVTFVIDGGGWNVYSHWKDEWPNLKRLMARSVVYRNGFMGSFPTVTACAHATIGTGEFPRRHGISGHNVRYKGAVAKAYGDIGHADPSFVLAPTVSEAWAEHTDHRAWIGEIGYQIWHLGMIGHGDRQPRGSKPVAIYFDEDVTKDWQPQNPDLYRMPAGIPTQETLRSHLQSFGQEDLLSKAGRNLCCSEPIVRYQGDVIASLFDNEPLGRGGDPTSLLYVNYKMPDYTGHVYNFLHDQEARVIRAVDDELGRLVTLLERRFNPGEYVLIVTADHGQCPLVEEVGGVRLDPIQLQTDVERAFGKSIFGLVQAVWPSEVYVNRSALWDAGITLDEIAAFLRDYRYRDNVGSYVRPGAVDRDRMNRPEFAAVFSRDYLARISDADVNRAGPGRYPEADPGIPPLLW
ncbi:MAG: alkaline phosphatase family protein, partial [Actinomycetota bacterium]